MFSQFRILKDILGYSASALVAQAVGLIAGFWVARLLGPADFGIWNAVSLVLAYGGYVDFGVLAAMGRDLPFHLGQGNTEKAESLEGAARWATVAGAGLVAVGTIIASFFFAQPLMRTGLRVMAIVLILQQAYTYHRTVLRANNRFGELSRQQLLVALISGGLSVLGVVMAGLLGRLIAALLAHAAIVSYAFSRNPWRPVARVKPAAMWPLMRVGLPITLSGSIMSLVSTVDRPMVIAFLGETELGYFGLALLLTSVISLGPAMVTQVLFPRITYQFGESGRDVATLRSFVLVPPVVLACLVPVLIGPVYFALPLVITLFLPAYAPGIEAMRIIVVGAFFSAVLGVTDTFLVATGKLRQYALFGGVALALNVALDYLVLRAGYGIEGVAVVGTGLTYFIYSSIVIAYALSHYMSKVRDWCRYFSRLWFPFVYMLGLLGIVRLTAGRPSPSTTQVALMVTVSTQVVLYLIGTLPLVLMAARELKLDLSLASLARVRSGR